VSTIHKIGFIIALLICLGGLVNIWNIRLAEGEKIGYIDGFNAGNTTGYQRGFEQGYAEGYRKGKQVGNSKGSVDGYNKGYPEGYNTGYPLGETDGFSSGRTRGFADGSLVWDKSQGYLDGVRDGARGYTIRDPTHQEVLDFLKYDETDKIPSEESSFLSIISYEGYYDHVASFKKHAHEAGYRCLWVNIELPDSILSELVAFNTTDRGMVFIDPENDKIVTFSIGEPYWDRNLYDVRYDDTVVSYDLIP